MKCPHCYSPNIKITASYSQRDVTIIECANCGRQSPMDVENMDVDTNVLQPTGKSKNKK